jgi:putative metallohydrolase (TIGR04338 family)
MSLTTLDELMRPLFASQKRERDSQRKKLYDAERAVFTDFYKPHFTTVQECQAFVDSVLARKRVQSHYKRAKRPVLVRPGHGARSAFGGYGHVTLPRWARSRHVILHELAHALEPAGAAHGWQFAQCYLWLVRQALGVEAAAKLEASFKAHKVRYRKPRTRKPMTQEQREAATVRLAAARAKRAGGALDG